MWPRDQESYNFVKGILSKESCHPKSQLSKFDAYIPYGSGYITFFLLRDVTWPHDPGDMDELLDLSHHFAKFHAHKSCTSWDEMFLICHKASYDLLVKVHIFVLVWASNPISPLCQIIFTGLMEVEI